MDVDVLNALLTAEYKAIEAYQQGAGVLSAPAPDGNATVLAVAVRFQNDHKEHAKILKSTIEGKGGTPVDETTVRASFALPAGFVANVGNVIGLACNAEKAAAIAYTDVQKSLTEAENAELVAAIGAVETQHFIILYMLGLGYATATDITQAQAADVVPKSFIVSVSGANSGLDTVADFSYAAD